MLLPTGAGETRFPKIEGMHFDNVEWFPDNKHILFTGNETGHATRTWMYDLETDQSKALTPEGTRGTRVSPDGKWFIRVDAHKLLLSPVDGGDSKTIVDLQGESAVRWSVDGRYLFLQQREPTSMKISRLDLTTRRKEPWLVVKVPEPGAQFLGPLALVGRWEVIRYYFPARPCKSVLGPRPEVEDRNARSVVGRPSYRCRLGFRFRVRISRNRWLACTPRIFAASV